MQPNSWVKRLISKKKVPVCMMFQIACHFISELLGIRSNNVLCKNLSDRPSADSHPEQLVGGFWNGKKKKRDTPDPRPEVCWLHVQTHSFRDTDLVYPAGHLSEQTLPQTQKLKVENSGQRAKPKVWSTYRLTCMQKIQSLGMEILKNRDTEFFCFK